MRFRKKGSNKIGFFANSYAFNRHKRLLAYSKMMEDAELILFTTNERGDIKKWKDIKNLKIVELKPSFLGYLGLIKYCSKNNLRYLTNLGFKSSLPLIFLNKLVNGTKYIAHTAQLGGIPLRYALFFRFADKVQTNDLDVLKELRQSRYGNKAFFTPAPTDELFYVLKDKKKIRRKLKLPIDKKIVLFVGRVQKTKGSEFLYDAINSNDDMLFIVIGAIKDKLFENFKRHNFLYLGEREASELVDYYNASDIGFFPIMIDGGGLAMTAHECLCCGTPILIANRKKEKDHPKFVVPARENSKGVTKALMEFFETSNRYDEITRRECRKFGMEKSSISSWTNAYRQVYLE